MLRWLFLCVFLQAVLLAYGQCPDTSAALITTTVFPTEDVLHRKHHDNFPGPTVISYSIDSNLTTPSVGQFRYTAHLGLEDEMKYYVKFPAITPPAGNEGSRSVGALAIGKQHGLQKNTKE